MILEDQILINKYAQNLLPLQQLRDKFEQYSLSQKRQFLETVLFMIMQSKPKNEDIEEAIRESGLKPTFTPCVLLQKGVANHDLKKIAGLPEVELSKAFILLLNLFKIAYKRRYAIEKNISDKWWYWDLSEDAKIEIILKTYNGRLDKKI